MVISNKSQHAFPCDKRTNCPSERNYLPIRKEQDRKKQTEMMAVAENNMQIDFKAKTKKSLRP